MAFVPKINNSRHTRIKKLRALTAQDGVDVWATDEVHFQQYGSRCQMWVHEVTDPTLLHYPTRESIGYIGAVRLRDGKFVFRRESDRFNAQSFFDFMRQLKGVSSRVGRKVIVMIADNARYHHAKLH